MNFKPNIRRTAPSPALRPKRGHPNNPYPYVDTDLGVRVTASRVAQHVPSALTRHQVMMMVAMDLDIAEIAKMLRVGKDTIYKYYQEELETGQNRATLLVGSKVFKTATTGIGRNALAAQRYWLNTRSKGKFNETKRHELSGPAGTPITTANFELTDSERAIRLFQLLASKSEGGTGQDPSEG